VCTSFINRRQFEITDHTRAEQSRTPVSTKVAVNDRALFTFSEEDGSVTYACAEVLSLLNYYPGGQLQPDMSWQNALYRYGYNTQERSDELYGPGNFYTAQFWEYDTRIWRRWNRDPVSFADFSVYAVFFNNPIYFIDPLGAEGEGNDGVFRPGSGPAIEYMGPIIEVVDRMPQPPLISAAIADFSMGKSFELMKFVATPAAVISPWALPKNIAQKKEVKSKSEPESLDVWAIFADVIRNVPLSAYGNPFYKAEAIYFDYGWSLVGAEGDKGWFFILVGEDKGKIFSFKEIAGGGGTDAGGGIEIGRIDVLDKHDAFNSSYLFGSREKFWISGGAGISAGGAVSWSTYNNQTIIGSSLQIGAGLSVLGVFSVGYNIGDINRD
jgi:hypothetical protein